MTTDDHFSPLSPTQGVRHIHKALILNELAHHEVLPAPLPPRRALGILPDFDHLSHLQFIISELPPSSAALSLQ